MRILLVDDDPVNRYILRENLEQEGYTLVEAEDGQEAWNYLVAEPDAFSVVVLDRMMPKMDGLAVLNRMMAHDTLSHVPVIMQTAAIAAHEVQEGVEAGAFFYLTKPFEQSMFRAIVQAALRKGMKQREVLDDLVSQTRSVHTMQSGTFRVQTIQEVHDLSILLAHACPDAEKIVMGLNDLMVNAVEHGNLGISYEEKTRLHDQEEWEHEVNRRLALPENGKKYVEVTFERLDGEIHIVITDQGKGFDWKPYEEFSPDLALASHGRGIAMAKALCFDQLEYQGIGNIVSCVVKTHENVASQEEAVPVLETTGIGNSLN